MNEQQPVNEIREREQELPYHSRIVLHLFRHGKKEKAEGIPDEKIHLTPAGRLQAHQKGQELKPQADVAIAIGSPRERAQETAARIMLHDKVSIEQDFDSIINQTKTKSDEKVVARKVIADDRLNFNSDGIAGKMLEEAYTRGETLKFLLKESDDAVLDNKDKTSTCLSRSAGGIADLVKKYILIADNFNRIVTSNPSKYQQYNNQMERYLGTHQCVGEGFLAKVLEKTKGPKAIDEFLEKTKGAGFNETQGFSLNIETTEKGTKRIYLKYDIGNGEEIIEISPSLIDIIIKERNILEQQIK